MRCEDGGGGGGGLDEGGQQWCQLNTNWTCGVCGQGRDLNRDISSGVCTIVK